MFFSLSDPLLGLSLFLFGALNVRAPTRGHKPTHMLTMEVFDVGQGISEMMKKDMTLGFAEVDIDQIFRARHGTEFEKEFPLKDRANPTLTHGHLKMKDIVKLLGTLVGMD